MINQYIEQIEKFSTIVPAVSVEIGALDGQYTRILEHRFRLSAENTYLVEPNPDLLEYLEREFPNAHRIPCAISSLAGSCNYNKVMSNSKNELGSSSLRTRIDRWSHLLSYDPVVVPSMTGASLFTLVNKPIDLCIVDVEGCAFEVLDSFGERLCQIRSLMIECEHTALFDGQRLYDDVADILVKSGFKQMAFQYSYAYQSDSVWIQERFIDFMKGWS